MKEYKYIFGPIPSRRMGLSLGVSPIPKKTCNYSCIYCQLGRTDKMTNERREYFPLEGIVEEFKEYIKNNDNFDVVTVVGEGEPTLYSRLGELIDKLKALTEKPVAVIANGGLFDLEEVRADLMKADIVLPTFDACDEEEFIKVNRPIKKINFKDIYEGLAQFCREYKGQLWVEVMLVRGFNDSEGSLRKLRTLLEGLRYDRLYINTPVRPPAEGYAAQVSKETMIKASEILNGIAIDTLTEGSFYSEEKDDYKAILDIIKRHPMNQHEIISFLTDRNAENIDDMVKRLEEDSKIEVVNYKGYKTFRLI
ncbi:wyosine [tRNA(Phe)-imidazoG37] synthetase (radical SAM superfamily) [Clostridium pascui]|uniref:radical SAM protein n=1 Tax=Clostridium pascui TaxID=46609 RepID=UPI00195D9F88|nr:radical SAM protein [Clostridium pascui]MBM7871178.1 wyosine [tRNA(Phe)-imidazoG37] synthetase (radical SAM superfamily) [Clostridium pascui]